MTFKEKLQHKYALSEQGAKDMLKGFVTVTISNIILMLPVGMLYMLVKNYMNHTLEGKGIMFAAGCILCLLLIGITTYIQYNATFLSQHLCRERRTPYQSCRKASQNSTVFLRKERFIRSDKYDHGRLRHTGNRILTLDPGTGWCLYFHSIGCTELVLL